MKPGDRVRFNERCPWPQRVGAEGMIVAPRADGMYPQPAKNEVLVYLDSDPLQAARAYGEEWWTCAADRRSLDAI